MNQEVWSKVDRYLAERLIPADPVLDAALAESDAAGLPSIQVSPAQGKFLHLLARIHGAKRILEIGTLGGYSTIWLGRALPPNGKLLTLEVDSKHAAVAQANIDRAGLADKVEIILGSASESLATLIEQDEAPFDLVFIDADKPSTPGYFQKALQLTGPGAVIIVDNVARRIAAVEAESGDPGVEGIREFLEIAAKEPRVTGVGMQTTGAKGYDGFAMFLVTS